MNIKTRKLKGYIALSILLILCLIMASAMTFYAPNNDAEAIAVENMDSQAADLGNLLLDGYENDTTGTGKVFNGDVFWKLVEKVTDSTSYNKNNIDTLTAVKTSADFRSKNGNKDIVVTIDGKQWIATYLSTNTSGDPILTFWLANNETTSTWSTGENNYKNSWGNQYTSNLYGTSFIRAVTLNNGGDYADTDSHMTTNSPKSLTSPWAIYTVPNTTSGMKGSLT
ncbi:MAG: hypothetical protein HDT29_03545, partial [Clostridiales bacterium]|nr:hypothetical protein [Clostridiales bacterium]